MIKKSKDVSLDSRCWRWECIVTCHRGCSPAGRGAQLQAEVRQDTGATGGVGPQGVHHPDWLHGGQGHAAPDGLPERLPGVYTGPAGHQRQVLKHPGHGVPAAHRAPDVPGIAVFKNNKNLKKHTFFTLDLPLFLKSSVRKGSPKSILRKVSKWINLRGVSFKLHVSLTAWWILMLELSN
jgi:hypothetical protein